MEEKYEEFLSYLSMKDIYVDKSISINSPIDIDKVDEYIEALSKFHKGAMGYNDYIEGKIPSAIGENIEQCKTSLRKMKRYLSKLCDKSFKNDVDKLLLSKGLEVINISELSIKRVYRENIIGLIQRSMERKEIAIGAFTPYNLKIDGGDIKAYTLNRCSYDLVESDYIRMLIKIRKYRPDLITKKLLKKCIDAEGLNEESYEFIRALSLYPYDLIRQISRYRENRKLWSLETYYRKISSGIDKYMSINI